MKKLFCGILAAVLILGCLAGCNSTTTATVENVIDKLKSADIPITYHIVYTDENDPNGKDNDYLQKGNFVDERIEIDYSEEEPTSGTIEIFNNSEDAKKRADYINQFSIDDYQYQIIKDGILLRLNNAFTKEQVSEYKLAIDGELYHSPSAERHQASYSYGQLFAIHANQLKEGMSLDEAIQIMGFEPENSLSYYVWFDKFSSGTVMAKVENEIIVSLTVDLESDGQNQEQNTNEPEDEVNNENNENSLTSSSNNTKDTAKSSPSKEDDSGNKPDTPSLSGTTDSNDTPANNEPTEPPQTSQPQQEEPSQDVPQSPTVDNSGKITLAKYNQISNGMSYEQVRDIIGSEGTKMAETEVAGYYGVTYNWEGVGKFGANAVFVFLNNELQSKAQYGLE